MLTDSEQARVRIHLGYPQTLADKSLQFGLVRSVETSYLVDVAVKNLRSETEDRVRECLVVLDKIEKQMVDALDTSLLAVRVDSISLRVDQTDALENEYRRWGLRLAEHLGVPVYQYSQRYRRRVGPGHVGSVPVRR